MPGPITPVLQYCRQSVVQSLQHLLIRKGKRFTGTYPVRSLDVDEGDFCFMGPTLSCSPFPAQPFSHSLSSAE